MPTCRKQGALNVFWVYFDRTCSYGFNDYVPEMNLLNPNPIVVKLFPSLSKLPASLSSRRLKDLKATFQTQ